MSIKKSVIYALIYLWEQTSLYIMLDKLLLKVSKFCQEFQVLRGTKKCSKTLFTYLRVFEDGNYYFLSNNKKWYNLFTKDINNINKAFEKSLRRSLHEALHCENIWPWDSCLPPFQIFHSLSYFIRGQGYVDSWIFSYLEKDKAIDSYFLNNNSRFKRFITLFQVNNFIKDIEQHCPKFKFGREVCLQQIENPHIITSIKLPDLKFPVFDKYNSLRLLTDKQFFILKMAAQGHNNEIIAEHMSISIGVVNEHRERIKRKLGVSFWNEVIQLYWKTIEIWGGI